MINQQVPASRQLSATKAVLGRTPATAYFTENQPMATHAGLEVLSGPRDVALAKRLVAESGYKGETVLLIVPSDQPAINQLAQVTRELFMKVGLTVDYQVMDWGSLLTRRANQNPPAQGGWNAFNTLWGGLTVSNPGSSYPLRGVGRKGWFGWPTDERLEALRDAWFDAPDLAAQRAIAGANSASGTGVRAIHPAWANFPADRVSLRHQGYSASRYSAVLGRSARVVWSISCPGEVPGLGRTTTHARYAFAL